VKKFDAQQIMVERLYYTAAMGYVNMYSFQVRCRQWTPTLDVDSILDAVA